MQASVRLALIRQALGELLRLREPTAVADWKPTSEQRARYCYLLGDVLNHADIIQSDSSKSLLEDAGINEQLPEGQWEYFRTELQPRFQALKAALRTLDPESAEFWKMLERIGAPSGQQGKVKATFDVGLEKVFELIDNEPHLEDRLCPEKAAEVLDSRLIGFAPDAWLDRAGHLSAIWTAAGARRLPREVEMRLLEVYRSYIFGNWLSVLALCRSALEFAVFDNISRFDIDPLVPKSAARYAGEQKQLVELLNELARYIGSVDQMHLIRRYGNEYLHAGNPEYRANVRPLPSESEDKARTAIKQLKRAMEDLYAAPSP